MRNLYQNIKSIIPRNLRATIKRLLKLEYRGRRAFSQEGEDLVLSRIFSNKQNGFYVDVGAHHPIKFSNTYLFYRLGWRGINIDAAPGSMVPFERQRPRDVNLEMGISLRRETRKFYVFEKPALNTFDEATALRHQTELGVEVIATHEVMCVPLAAILAQHLPPDCDIDFLSIDVEGLDLQVISSNDWSKYRPKVVVIEILDRDVIGVLKTKEHSVLSENGYRLYAKTGNSVVYVMSQCA